MADFFFNYLMSAGDRGKHRAVGRGTAQRGHGSAMTTCQQHGRVQQGGRGGSAMGRVSNNRGQCHSMKLVS